MRSCMKQIFKDSVPSLLTFPFVLLRYTSVYVEISIEISISSTETQLLCLHNNPVNACNCIVLYVSDIRNPFEASSDSAKAYIFRTIHFIT